MDESRPRQTVLRAGLLMAALGSVAACGSGASPSTGGGKQSAGGSGPTLESSHVGPATAQLFDDEAVPTPPDLRPRPGPFVCMRDPVAFDLSKLKPVSDTPLPFWFAWVQAQARAEVPGFVVVYTGLATGPSIQQTVGAVSKAGPSTYRFMARQPPSMTEAVWQDPNDPLHIAGSNDARTFGTAFGPERERQGFYISTIRVEGHLDPTCQALHNVTVTMTLPKENEGQRFGNQSIEGALGPMSVDSDSDGHPDSWRVTMAAQSLDALMFRP